MMEEAVNMEAFYVCDFCRKFVSLGQPCRGVHQDSQICNKNHIFVTSLARFNFFVTGFTSFLCLRRTKLILGLVHCLLEIIVESHVEILAKRIFWGDLFIKKQQLNWAERDGLSSCAHLAPSEGR